MDPKAENVLTGVNFGRGLPRSLYAKDVPVASVGDLGTYGLFPDIEDDEARNVALSAFSQMYGGLGKDTMANFFSDWQSRFRAVACRAQPKRAMPTRAGSQII